MDIPFTNTKKYLRQFGSDGVALTRAVLKKKGKVATMLTADSVEFVLAYHNSSDEFIIEVSFYADESMQYIQDGRPKGAKMPPSIFSRKGHRLNLWFGAKGIPRNKSTDFLVRRAIKKKGIEPVPVIDMAYEDVKVYFDPEKIKAAVLLDIKDYAYDTIRKSIEGLK